MHASPLVFLLVLVGVGTLLCAVAIAVMAWSLMHPPRMTDGKAAWVLRRLSPADVGLPFEEMTFEVHDEHGKSLKLAAWWIPNPAAGGRCAVLIHGYADAKVGAIAWAPVWHSLGFNLLVPDLRAHGESDGSVCTAGFFERHDLVQIIHDLRTSRPHSAREVVLFGVSMGAALAAAVASTETGITAVVMESPYADFRKAAMAHMDHLGLPGRALQRPAINLAQWLTRADYDAVSPVRLIPTITCPLMLIESGNDPFLSTEARAELKRAIVSRPKTFGPAEIWAVPDVEHSMALSANPQIYREQLGSFLIRAAVSAEMPEMPVDGV